jgi:hypothetical protein
MLALAKEFPGAILVFATLREALTSGEKRLLRPVANRGRKHWKAERPHNPVLILTGNELFADDDPREVWKHLDGVYASHTRSGGDGRDLVGLSDATQQIYLGMQSRQKSISEKEMARQRRRNLKSSSPLAPGDRAQAHSKRNQDEGFKVSFPVAMRQIPWG